MGILGFCAYDGGGVPAVVDAVGRAQALSRGKQRQQARVPDLTYYSTRMEASKGIYRYLGAGGG
jgi:hypothetical protein